MYNFFIALMILLYLGRDCACKAEKPKITDTLFTSHFEQFRGVAGERRSELRELISVIYSSKDEQMVPELIKFMTTNKRYGSEILHFFIQKKDTTFLNWFKKSGLQLGVSIDYWKILNWNMHTLTKKSTHFEYNNKMLDILIGFLEHTSDTSFWNNTLNLINSIGTYKQIQSVNKLKKCFCDDIFLTLQTRFKSPSTDSIVNRQIGRQQKLSLIEYFAEFGLKEYNRYDYIPFLYNYKRHLMAEKDIRLEDEIKRTMPIIDDAISYLEMKKAENAPIGLPLDWPVNELKR